MKNKSFRKLMLTALALTLTLTMLLPCTAAYAADAPPTSINAPLNFAAVNYRGGAVTCTLSAPDDLRALIDTPEKDRGYHVKIQGQVDFKVDNGDWHSTADWDNPSTFEKYALNYYNGLSGGENGKYLADNRLSFKPLFANDPNIPVPAAFTSWDWYKKHTMTLRARFAVTFGRNVVFSPWSKEYVLSNASKMDYKKIMNDNAPTLISSKIEVKGVTKVPWVGLQLGRHPDQTQLFNAASGNAMWTEVWLRKQGDTEFKKVGDANFCNEIVWLNVGAYFGTKLQDYSAQGYEVKVRYKIDERNYQQSNQTAMTLLYSPYSNTLAYNMPSWSGASKWATAELQKASEMGLIPDILNGADMTKNITREEFAEVALLMYQKASGVTDTAPASPNPFADTTNQRILKAFKLGIVKGVSATEFAPKALINREQVSAMLTRAVKLIAPNADYSTTGAPAFNDQKDISGWALNDCLYMAKIGIIKGTDGKFMPRAVSEAQKAVGYANTSREQALAMSVRSVDKVKEIK